MLSPCHVHKSYNISNIWWAISPFLSDRVTNKTNYKVISKINILEINAITCTLKIYQNSISRHDHNTVYHILQKLPSA